MRPGDFEIFFKCCIWGSRVLCHQCHGGFIVNNAPSTVQEEFAGIRRCKYMTPRRLPTVISEGKIGGSDSVFGQK